MQSCAMRVFMHLNTRSICWRKEQECVHIVSTYDSSDQQHQGSLTFVRYFLVFEIARYHQFLYQVASAQGNHPLLVEIIERRNISKFRDTNTDPQHVQEDNGMAKNF